MVNIEDYVNKSLEVFPNLLKIIDKKMKKFQENMKKKEEPDFGDMFGGFFNIIIESFEEFSKDFEKIGMSAQEFMKFGDDHKEEVEEYLKEHPELKDKMESFAKEFDGLTKQ